jgi:hypothetical protein
MPWFQAETQDPALSKAAPIMKAPLLRLPVPSVSSDPAPASVAHIVKASAPAST